MATLTIHQGPMTKHIAFEAPEKLHTLLLRAGIADAQPCGGRGVCGKCAVLLTGSISAPNAAEEACGTRLTCQAVVTGDATAVLPVPAPMEIEGGRVQHIPPIYPAPGDYGAAIDIGTTTLALALYHLKTGRKVIAASMLNPQTSVAADVIGRIGAAMSGQAATLRTAVQDALRTLLHQACAQAGVAADAVTSYVVTGNTTMLYLLTGRDPAALSHAPFEADCLFGESCSLWGSYAYLPRCIHGFVGADAMCALLASGIPDRKETALLMDVGTNGEILLWHEGRLYAASTAAGPAFEGAGIQCGCGSITGAIDRVDAEGDQLTLHTIGGGEAVGICGSGLVDAIAALLDMEVIDETGAMEVPEYPLSDGVILTRKDIRVVQLAKGAIAACVTSLLRAAHCTPSQVRQVCLAGGFGSHLRIDRAARIGLISPALADRVTSIGNAALDGAAMLLMDTAARHRLDQLAKQAIHVSLDGDPFFASQFAEAMLFESD